ncbi:MAG: DUF1513 domain-containing protein [Aphanocapsa feldmannii 277cV]|uniref:DUF1513 domain-containing protein n=1 Tax=Aphanocapsa feldmannii 277cV TaxID=2507553 RepID=A0A524RNL4_9CHRO|nr:MAG: DUF1513 domain-containing protein [Aphanocapsa feldmannii 277cV]
MEISRRKLFYILLAGIASKSILDASIAAKYFSVELPFGLIITWRAAADKYQVGMFEFVTNKWLLRKSIPLPSRAHQLTVLPDRSILITARRPGDWLFRWWPERSQHEVQEGWLESGLQYNGHSMTVCDHRWILSSATEKISDSGLLILHSTNTLQPVKLFDSGGKDPHDIMIHPQQPIIWVANGGVHTHPDLGRQSYSEQALHASIAQFDIDSIENSAAIPHFSLSNIFYLNHAWLSPRHLSFQQYSHKLGVALQCLTPRNRVCGDVPTLAIISIPASESHDQGDTADLIHYGQAEPDMLGYAGDITATRSGFLLSSPRGNVISEWSLDGRLQYRITADKPCGLLSYGSGHSVVSQRNGVFHYYKGALLSISKLHINPDNHIASFPY